MIKSQLTLDILDLFFDGEKECELFKNQIKYLNVSEIEYTGVGVFISFGYENEVYKYKAYKVLQNSELKSENGIVILNGVEIKNENLEIESDVMIRIDDGIIESIEIFNKNGKDYPQYEIEQYEIYQNWENYNRKIIR